MGYVGNAPYNGIVNEGNIADNAVTTSKIAPDTVVAADIAAGAVGTSELANDAVTTEKIADDAIGLAELSATGTPSASTYLRGDNSWAAVPAATPGGSTTHVQYNNSGVFAGDSGFVYTGGNVGIGTSSPTGKLNVHGGSGNSKLKLSNTASGNSSGDGFDLDFTGTDIYITNRESGFMAFENAGAERMRIGSAGQIGLGGANYGTSGQVLTSNGSGAAPSWQSGGKVLQVKQLVVSSALTQTGGQWTTWVDLSGYSFTIQPTSASSRVLYQISFGAMTQSTNAIVFRLVRNGTIIGVGDASGSRPQATFRNMREGDANHTRTAPHFTYLDSPGTTSPVEYKLQWTGEASSPTLYINRAQNDTDGQSYGARTISTVTLWEIAP